MSFEDTEKDNRLYDSKNRDLRNKNSDLQKENKRLFNEQIDIQKTLIELLEHKKKLEGDVKAVKNELVQAKKYLEELKSSGDGLKNEMDRRERDLIKALEAFYLDQDQLQKDRNALKEREARNKQDRKILDDGGRDLNKREDFLNQKEVKLEQAVAALNTERKEFTLVKDNAKAKDAEMCENIKKAKDLATQALAKKDEAEKKLGEIKEKERVLAKQVSEIEKKEKEIVVQLKFIQDESGRLKGKEFGLDKRSEGLDIREKEIEIKRLRVAKLIREKDIENELKALEKEVSK